MMIGRWHANAHKLQLPLGPSLGNSKLCLLINKTRLVWAITWFMIVWHIYHKYVAPRLTRHERAIALQAPGGGESRNGPAQRERMTEVMTETLP